MKKHTVYFILFLFLSFPVWSQQQRLIRGIVYEKDTKEPLAGVNVRIQNTGLGSITMNDGRFVYTIKSDNIPQTVLEISFVGYKRQLIIVGDKNTFTIYLEEDNANLNEVIITSSYGTKKLREEVVGSIVQVKAADLQVSQAVESFDKMLEGVAAGVLVTGGSVVGGPVRIDIRGQGSLTPIDGNLSGTSTQPLIIIDGIVMNEEKDFNSEIFDGFGIIGERSTNPLSKIAPEDIEELTILKDAAAVGIYGADAANGVILITTKKFKGKKPSFNFSTQTGFSKPINQIKYLSGPQYHDIYKEYLINRGQTEQQASINAGSNTIDTNWFNLLNRSGLFKRYNFDVGFGIKNINFRASLNVLDNEEPQLSNNYKRYGGNFNFGYNGDKFSVQLSISPSISRQNAPNTLYNFPLKPNLAPYDDQGNYSLLDLTNVGNPLAVAAQNKDFTEIKGLLASINASYKLSNAIDVSAIFGIDSSDKISEQYSSGYNESGRFNGTFIYPDANGNNVTYPNWGRRSDATRDSFRWNSSLQLKYQKKVRNNNFDAILGFELQSEEADRSSSIGTGFINPGPINKFDDGNRNRKSYLFSKNTRRSFFSQFNYNYDSRYFALINIRSDESSAFGKDNKQNLNGGAGLSWNISNEAFLKNSKFVDFFRWRISYGLTGNSRINSNSALGLYSLDLSGSDGYNGGDYATPSSSPNPLLTWEKNYKFNTGFDFNFLNKFRLTLEFFRDEMKDLILSRDIPLETGFSTIEINGGSQYNQGLELSLQAKWFKNENFNWTTNFNISTIDSKVTALKGIGTDFSSAERARAQKIGSPTTAIWGVRYAGVDPATGRELFLKDGMLYDATTYNSLFDIGDSEIIGDSQPAFFGGVQNNFTFLKRFNLGVRASFRYGDDILIDDELESQYRILVNRNVSVNVIDRWQKPGDIAQHPRVSGTNPIIQNSSKFIYDASHIKIQNINMSYDVPIAPQNKKWIKRMSVSMDISNVAYFYKDKSLRGRNGIAEYRFNYPEARTLTFGFQANF